MVLPHRKIKLMSEDDAAIDVIQPKPRGCLMITVVEARGLVGNEMELSTLWTGELTTDPYVRISFGAASWRSGTVLNDTSPEWPDQNVCLFVVDVPDRQEINVNVFDDGVRQRLQTAVGGGENASDEVARFAKPTTVMNMLGKCHPTEL